MTFLYYSFLTLFLVLSFFLTLLVLIQKGRGGGLSAAFGGVGGNTAFGAKTGDVLTWATSVVFGIFLVLAIVLNLIANNQNERYKQSMAGATTAPAAVSPASGLDNGQIALPPVNPTPQPPPTPTTNPSTKPDHVLPAVTPSTQPAK